jgi:hypothetical protein
MGQSSRYASGFPGHFLPFLQDFGAKPEERAPKVSHGRLESGQEPGAEMTKSE